MVTTITYLTTIHFGSGAIKQIRPEMQALGARRPLIVSDRGVEQAGLLDRVRRTIDAEAALFLDTPSNPTEEAVDLAVEMYKAEACDAIIMVGGGSPIDLGKGVALAATHDLPLADYAAINGGVPKIRNHGVPLIAVPTTAGTGSEVGRAALLTLRDGKKLGFVSPYLIPTRAVCDPDLTLDMPPRLTAASAFDALSHCIETYCSPRDNPPAEAIALDGLARIWTSLPRVLQNGKDAEARAEVMMGALQGGLTFQKGLGAVHALSHALGGLKEPRLHHGTLNAILLPPVLRFNAEAIPEKFARLRETLKLDAAADLATLFEDAARQSGIPSTLTELGVPKDVVPYIVERALADHSHPTNPRPASADDYAQMLHAVMP